MASPIDIVTLDEAKAFLNIDNAASDAELPQFVTAASQMWVGRVGPVSGGPVADEWYDGGSSNISLRKAPVLGVSLVQESLGSTSLHTLTEQPLTGDESDAWGYTVDLASGLLTRRASGVAVPFQPGARNIHVVYTAGYSDVPEDIRHAVLLLVSHLWQTQRGSGRRTGGTDAPSGSSYSWPYRVQEIAQAYIIPGIA